MHLYICPQIDHTFLTILAFETLLSLGISVNLPWGGYGYFLELHTGQLLVTCQEPVSYSVDQQPLIDSQLSRANLQNMPVHHIITKINKQK